MLIDLFLTPLAKRCVLYEHPNGLPLHIDSRSELYRNLSRATFSENSTKAQSFCTETLLVNVNKKLFDHLAKENLLTVGWNLHKFYINQMVTTVAHTTIMSNVNAIDTIRKYFAIRNISEDEFALESAYKAWQRYQNTFQKNFAKKEVFTSTKKGAFVSNCRCLNFDYTLKKLLAHFQIEKSQIIGYPLASPNLTYNRQIILFLLHALTNTPYRELEKHFKINYTNIFQSVKNTSFNFRKKLDDNLVTDINAAFEAVFYNSPLPSSAFIGLLNYDNS